jgi:hypothetical protein
LRNFGAWGGWWCAIAVPIVNILLGNFQFSRTSPQPGNYYSDKIGFKKYLTELK